MAIRKGEDWGHPGALERDGRVVSSNAELRQLLTEAGGPEALDPVGVIGGDLALTLGSPGRRERLYSDQAQTVQIDVGRVQVAGTDQDEWFVSHLVARRSWWRGPLLVAANSAWMGEWNIAPRAHPGDGRLDVLMTSMPASERWKGRRRLAHGGHLPHPAVSVRRLKHVQEDFARPLDIWVDGERIVRSSGLTIDLIPAALTVVV